MVMAIRDKILRQQQAKPFVEKFVKYAGFPVWDKAIVASARLSGKQSSGQKNGNPSQIIYIPMVIDSGVNAILKATFNETDTAFKVMYKWQYNKNGYTATDSTNSAAQTALFFMGFENNIFGHKYFDIRDKKLFGEKDTAVNLISIESFNENAGNRWSQLTITICYKEFKTGGWLTNGPDYNTYTATICKTYVALAVEGGDSGGGGYNGGGGSNPGCGGTGGGGGTGDGSWYEDPCIPTKNPDLPRMDGTTSPCDQLPAWQPADIALEISNELSLKVYQKQWLIDNPERMIEVYNYLQTIDAPERISIAKEHIIRMMTDAPYLELVTNHAQHGNPYLMWWMDADWLDIPVNFSLSSESPSNEYPKFKRDGTLLNPNGNPDYWGTFGTDNENTATHGINGNTQLTPTNQ